MTCCGVGNFEQHCASKRHLRKLMQAGAGGSSDSLAGPSSDHEAQEGEAPESQAAAAAGREGGAANTYVGPSADCRSYCKQVHSRCRPSLRTAAAGAC